MDVSLCGTSEKKPALTSKLYELTEMHLSVSGKHKDATHEYPTMVVPNLTLVTVPVTEKDVAEFASRRLAMAPACDTS